MGTPEELALRARIAELEREIREITDLEEGERRAARK